MESVIAARTLEDAKMVPNRLLKQARELRGWSQAKVAREIGTDATTVSRWERGLFSPTPYFRERLCTLFGKNTEELGLLENIHQMRDYEERAAGSALSPTATSLLELQEWQQREVHTGPLAHTEPLVHTGPLVHTEPLLDPIPPRWSECTDTFTYILHSAAHDQQAHMLWKDAYVRALRGQHAEARQLGEASLRAFECIGHINAIAVREWLNQQAFLPEDTTPAFGHGEPAPAFVSVETTPLFVSEDPPSIPGHKEPALAFVSAEAILSEDGTPVFRHEEAAPACIPVVSLPSSPEQLQWTLKRFLRERGARIALLVIGSFWLLFALDLPSIQ
jgi:transcriptional regulator with XRE-family HTH domain